MYQVIDGKKISQEIKDELKEKAAAMAKEGKKVALAVIQVGNDPASSVYVRNKKKACEYIGIESLSYELPEETTEEELVALIEKLNADAGVNGILVQLPLPEQINEEKIIQTISRQGCRWIPYAECRCIVYRRKRLCILYPAWNYYLIKTLWN